MTADGARAPRMAARFLLPLPLVLPANATEYKARAETNVLLMLSLASIHKIPTAKIPTRQWIRACKQPEVIVLVIFRQLQAPPLKNRLFKFGVFHYNYFLKLLRMK